MMKKNMYEAFDTITYICEKSMELDEMAVKCLICMLIDTASAVHGEKASDIAGEINYLVTEVNNEIGAYQLFPGGL